MITFLFAWQISQAVLTGTYPQYKYRDTLVGRHVASDRAENKAVNRELTRIAVACLAHLQARSISIKCTNFVEALIRAFCKLFVGKAACDIQRFARLDRYCFQLLACSPLHLTLCCFPINRTAAQSITDSASPRGSPV